jgi:hypothetical protein
MLYTWLLKTALQAPMLFGRLLVHKNGYYGKDDIRNPGSNEWMKISFA